MSDINDLRFISSNIDRRRSVDGHMDRSFRSDLQRRTLVEECIAVSISDLKKSHTRKALLKASDEGRPVCIQLYNNDLQTYLTYDIHRLPDRNGWSDIAKGDVRLWLVCPSCHRKSYKLFYKPSSSAGCLNFGCRRCLRLRYMSQNCGSNAWWKQIAKPIRKLKRRRAKLLNGKPSHRAINEINEIEGLIFVYSSRAAAKQKSVRSEKKRRYCDVHLLLGEDWG